MLGGVRVLVEQRLGGDEEAGRADAALQGRAFEEALLERMQMAVLRRALRPSRSSPLRPRRASTRQLLTGTPSSSTVQAPQLPLLQPSFAPVSRSVSRSTSSRLCRGSQRNSTGFAVDGRR